MNEPSMQSDTPPGEPDSQQIESQSVVAPPPFKPKNFFFKPTTKKLALTALVFGLLQIPLTMILGVIEERQTYNVDYPQEYNGAGAAAQTVIGPVLTVPYHYLVTEEKQVTATDEQIASATKTSPAPPTKTIKVTKTETSYLHFFPDNLNVNGQIMPDIRDEGKFKSIVYASTLKFKGTFDTSDLKQKKINESDVVWSDAYVAVGISDLRGIRSQSTLQWNSEKPKFIPGVNGLTLFTSGQYTPVNMTASGINTFAFTLELNGSKYLNIFPAGKQNKIALDSTWREPTFMGGFLPTEKVINKQGFKAMWETSYFSRNLPQVWTEFDPCITNSLAQYTVGVNLQTPVEFYRTAIRAVKYGSLFIVMTFVAFYFFERFFRIRIHEMQYLLVGLALSLFFLLLIAISEQIPFVWAYIIASVSTIIQITWYTKAFAQNLNKNLWKVMTVTLSMLYGYLYILLQLEGLSLLFGAIGLFIMLSGILYTTRNVNWYADDPMGEVK